MSYWLWAFKIAGPAPEGVRFSFPCFGIANDATTGLCPAIHQILGLRVV